MRPAIPQRTADSRCVAPTPTIAPVIVCVVLTGMPSRVANRMVNAPAVSAQNPPTGRSRVIREPMVCTIRHPPNSVPSEIITYAATSTLTYAGGATVGNEWSGGATVGLGVAKNVTVNTGAGTVSMPIFVRLERREYIRCSSTDS